MKLPKLTRYLHELRSEKALGNMLSGEPATPDAEPAWCNDFIERYLSNESRMAIEGAPALLPTSTGGHIGIAAPYLGHGLMQYHTDTPPVEVYRTPDAITEMILLGEPAHGRSFFVGGERETPAVIVENNEVERGLTIARTSEGLRSRKVAIIGHGLSLLTSGMMHRMLERAEREKPDVMVIENYHSKWDFSDAALHPKLLPDENGSLYIPNSGASSFYQRNNRSQGKTIKQKKRQRRAVKKARRIQRRNKR